jgi:hypothetical protein
MVYCYLYLPSSVLCVASSAELDVPAAHGRPFTTSIASRLVTRSNRALAGNTTVSCLVHRFTLPRTRELYILATTVYIKPNAN